MSQRITLAVIAVLDLFVGWWFLSNGLTSALGKPGETIAYGIVLLALGCTLLSKAWEAQTR